ncbi:MAG: twin-arginine translocase TatA/TatE family subunit [Blastocatellia bacterium]|nr:twin-arginine translocase TatA/TatE family subunit [Blastocatellia bacterium]
MLGTGEIVLILVIALIVFGPRKLPELGKSMGQAMAQFRRASEDFKRTWEQEVEHEKVYKTDNLSTTASSEFSSTEANDPYNPYSEQVTAQDTGPTPSHAVESSPAPSEAHAMAGTIAETAKAPEKQHWI